MSQRQISNLTFRSALQADRLGDAARRAAIQAFNAKKLAEAQARDAARAALTAAKASPLFVSGSFDRAAGLAFGVLRGILVVSLLVLLIRRTDETPATADPMQDAIRGARTYPIYNSVASALEVVLPQARDRARDIIERREGESAPIPPAEPEATPAQP